jgi:hypothetical protein
VVSSGTGGVEGGELLSLEGSELPTGNTLDKFAAEKSQARGGGGGIVQLQALPESLDSSPPLTVT